MADHAFQFAGVPFDVLDAATFKALTAFNATLFIFARQELGPAALVQYTLTAKGLAGGEPGDLGRIELCKGVDGGWLQTYGPPRPKERQWTDEERASAGRIENQEERYAKVNEVQAEIRAEAEGAYQSRKELHGVVVEGLLSRLCPGLAKTKDVTPDTDASQPERERKYGTTEKVLDLADTADRLKQKDRRLSQLKVATKLNTTVGAIRYAYRMKGWKWERADKVRP